MWTYLLLTVNDEKMPQLSSTVQSARVKYINKWHKKDPLFFSSVIRVDDAAGVWRLYRYLCLADEVTLGGRLRIIWKPKQGRRMAAKRHCFWVFRRKIYDRLSSSFTMILFCTNAPVLEYVCWCSLQNYSTATSSVHVVQIVCAKSQMLSLTRSPCPPTGS